jgi:hypothetical protein
MPFLISEDLVIVMELCFFRARGASSEVLDPSSPSTAIWCRKVRFGGSFPAGREETLVQLLASDLHRDLRVVDSDGLLGGGFPRCVSVLLQEMRPSRLLWELPQETLIWNSAPH